MQSWRSHPWRRQFGFKRPRSPTLGRPTLQVRHAYHGRVAGIPIPEAARQLLDSDTVANVVTINQDGGPHVTAAWVGLEGDEIVLATIPEQRKLRNLRRDPRVALSLQSTNVNKWGLLEYLVVYGTARVTQGGAPELLQRLAHTYLGPDVVFPNMPDPPPGFITRITPERAPVERFMINAALVT
jgi:PPOX class probable F420-dependent enzyme